MIVFCIDMRDKLIIMVSMKAQVDIKLEKNHEGEEVVEGKKKREEKQLTINPD